MVASGPYRVIVSPRAFDDLDEILDYIKSVSPVNAAKTIDRLRAATERLNEMPHRYRVVQGLSRPERAVRRMPVRPYLVYYRIDETNHTVRVLTIRHGHRRQPRRFG